MIRTSSRRDTLTYRIQPRLAWSRLMRRLLVGVLLVAACACGTPPSDSPTAVSTEPAQPAPGEGSDAPPPSPAALDDDPVLGELRSFDDSLGLADEWTGDLDELVARGYLRALVSYSKTQYFLDGAQQRGISYEALQEFQKFLNQRLG